MSFPKDRLANQVGFAPTRSQDIKERYRSTDFLPGNRVIFNIKGNHYRLVIRVHYQNGIVYIEWVGTHAEYSKRSFGGE